jgi:hypothetical protein
VGGVDRQSGGRVERMRGRVVEATTRQPAGERETDVATANVTVMATVMAMGNAVPPPSRDLAKTALVLAAEAAVVLIEHDANGGDGGVSLVREAGK